ncbi:MFS transporter, MHS family, proline/betaine transporter [Bradyrhizobium lablabi]|uniref:MFS transporter, MHS family, proline/betaine transporter n=1 Tax=Bradyrhizobium lablabi TaxID=722472 RepID=A0A1M6YCN8_9BRAD|nr:MFS transporter [Bradyrhizobium lablabi]SHL15775.1 MFS transporter, MHS family, proline/betaine transporter [Bradyrhizobium lablabi]
MTLSAPVELPGMSQAGPEEKNITKLIVAVSIGNALEWFDISSYGYFAVYVSKAFFPNSDATVSLLLTFGTFGLAFLVRPIGGVLLGAYADRYGRKASLMISIVMMTFGTLSIAIMPTYETIGILAPIAVLVARLVQGFSAGGEFGSSTAFLVEHRPGRRGFVASWQFASQGLSALLSSVLGVGLTLWMAPADMSAWGWRIPFLFGVLIGPVGIYIRNHLEDATAPPATEHGTPVREVFLRQKLRVLLGIGALSIATAVNYLVVFMPTYVVKTLGLPPIVGFQATLAGALAVTLLTPIAGSVSDRIGRTAHMIAVNLVLLVSIVPAFLLLTRNPTPMVIIGAVLWLSTLKALYIGPLAALMSELLPASTRATGLGLGYNIGVTLFGGMGPAIMTWLGTIAFIGDLSPAWYLTLVGFVSLSALITVRRTSAASHTA